MIRLNPVQHSPTFARLHRAEIRQPIAVITFSRGSINFSWELEMNQYNRDSWFRDYRVPLMPTPNPPDDSVPAGTLRLSELPVQEIVDAVNAANLGVNYSSASQATVAASSRSLRPITVCGTRTSTINRVILHGASRAANFMSARSLTGISPSGRRLAAWGPCPAPPDDCPADLDGDGLVGITDFLILLGNWG